jgi:hypothetical protein
MQGVPKRVIEMTRINSRGEHQSFGEGLQSARRHQQTYAPHQQYPYSIRSSARAVIVDGTLMSGCQPQAGDRIDLDRFE